MKCVLVAIFFSAVCMRVDCLKRNESTIDSQGDDKKTQVDKLNDSEDVGEPLFLTPFIEANEIDKARLLSKVNPVIGNITSYSGFLTTNETCGNNLFFWFFPAQEDWENASLMLWLQGGPGQSSMMGLFEEIGPFSYFPDGLKMRKYPWNVKNNILFIDQPVGTGYSFTEKECYAKDQTAIGENLYSAITQFLQLFPFLQRSKFFIAGESFAGHYIPAIAYTIHKNNPTAKQKINLAGMMIGNGLMDMREQINYGDYLYQIGLIDDNKRKVLYGIQNLVVQKIDAKDWKGAFNTSEAILGPTLSSVYKPYYNYLLPPQEGHNWTTFMKTSTTRKSIHVGHLQYAFFPSEIYKVYINLINNTMQSVKPWVETLLENGYPMVFYVGQLDIICAYPMVINFLRSLHWSGQEQYLNATRHDWYEKEDLAGYIKISNNLADVLVRNAGHMVPKDQPFWAYQLVNKFTSGGIQALIGENSDNEY